MLHCQLRNYFASSCHPVGASIYTCPKTVIHIHQVVSQFQLRPRVGRNTTHSVRIKHLPLTSPHTRLDTAHLPKESREYVPVDAQLKFLILLRTSTADWSMSISFTNDCERSKTSRTWSKSQPSTVRTESFKPNE